MAVQVSFSPHLSCWRAGRNKPSSLWRAVQRPHFGQRRFSSGRRAGGQTLALVPRGDGMTRTMEHLPAWGVLFVFKERSVLAKAEVKR